MWPPVFMGIGAALYFSLFYEPPFVVTGAMIAACASLFVVGRGIYHRHQGSEFSYLVFLVAMAVLMIGCGFALSQFRSGAVGTPMITKETRPVMISGVLDHVEDQEGGRGKQILLSDVAIEKWEKDNTPHTVRLTVRTKMEERVAAGDRVQMLAKLTSPAQTVMPGSYDYARHFYFEGIGGLGFALSEITLVQKEDVGFFDLDGLRRIVSSAIKESVSGPSQGIVVALMTGERAAIADDDWQALRASGLAHIISISGLHVAMVAAPVFFVARLFLAFIPAMALRFDIKKIAAFVALVACTLYVGFVVPSVPTTRALLMTGVALIAIMFDRSPFSLRLVGVSAILILIFSPESIWSASFQMSFAAVSSLVAAADWMRPVWLRLYREAGFIRKSVLYLAGAVAASFVASVATAPFVWFHFQQMASYSVLGNMLAMPLSGIIIMPMMIVSYLLIPFGWAGETLKLMAMGVDWMLDVARFVQSLPGALVTGAIAPPAFLYLMTLAGLVLVLFAGRWKLVSLVLLGAAFVSLLLGKLPDVLVSSSGEVVMVRDGRAGYVSTTRKERFVRDQWEKRLGLDSVAAFPKEGGVPLSSKGLIACDVGACRIETVGVRLVYGSSYAELQKDCDWADVIVSPKWLSKSFCPSARVIDAYSLRRQGAVQIYGDGTIETSRDFRGYRPWTR